MDSLQRFIFEQAPIRGQIVHLQEAYQSIMNQHPYPPMVRYLLGEALVSSLLLLSSIKFEGTLSLQFQGDERLPLILIQADSGRGVRGYAKYQSDLSTETYAEAFLQGKMVININQAKQTQSYQSIVPLHSTSMSENLTHYFAQSEQISTRVWLAVDDQRAAGMLLQLMPGQDTTQREQFWEYAIHLGQTVTENELLDLDNAELLHRLYHETEIRLFDQELVKFRCRCSEEKIKQVLLALGEKEANAALNEEGLIDIRCDFCNSHYKFDAIDVTLLFRKK